MPIAFTCHCGRTLKAPDHIAGRQVRCPECGVNLIVPGGQSVAAMAPQNLSVKMITRRGPNKMGDPALMWGLMGCLLCWIPFWGLFSWIFAALGIYSGCWGLVVAAIDGHSSFRSSIGGIVTGLLAAVLSLIVSLNH